MCKLMDKPRIGMLKALHILNILHEGTQQRALMMPEISQRFLSILTYLKNGRQ